MRVFVCFVHPEKGSALALVLVVVSLQAWVMRPTFLESRKVVKEDAQCHIGGWRGPEILEGGGPLSGTGYSAEPRVCDKYSLDILRMRHLC